MFKDFNRVREETATTVCPSKKKWIGTGGGHL